MYFVDEFLLSRLWIDASNYLIIWEGWLEDMLMYNKESSAFSQCLYVVGCAFWYCLYNLKYVKNQPHPQSLLLIAKRCAGDEVGEKHPWMSVTISKAAGFSLQPANLLKSNTPPWVFSRFLNCTNGTKLRKASHMYHSLNWKLRPKN